MCDRPRTAARRPPARGFTLPELLVVIGIIAVLTGVLMPAVVKARRQAQFVRCLSNVRQVCLALRTYSANNHGCFPPNVTPDKFWYDDVRAGDYLTAAYAGGSGAGGGGVLACPDDEGARRSYAMNGFASCAVGTAMGKVFLDSLRWREHVACSAQMLLVVECWSDSGSAAAGYYAGPVVAYVPATAGQLFGAAGGVSPPLPMGRFGPQSTWLPYARHPTGTFGATEASGAPAGRLNFGFGDGHAEGLRAAELADWPSGRPTGRAYWYPQEMEQ